MEEATLQKFNIWTFMCRCMLRGNPKKKKKGSVLYVMKLKFQEGVLADSPCDIVSDFC